MKKLIAPILALAAFASLSGIAHADVTHLTSRDSVRTELVRLEHAGYDPAHNSNNYPADIEAAEAKIHAQNAVATTAQAPAPAPARDASGYGYAPVASMQSGVALSHAADARDGLYTHH